jgi:hypothetical protein
MLKRLRAKLRGWLGIEACETVASANFLAGRIGRLELILGAELGIVDPGAAVPKSRLDALNAAIVEVTKIDGTQLPSDQWQPTKLGGALADLRNRLNTMESVVAATTNCPPKKPRTKAKKGR